MPSNPPLPLPKHWSRRVRSAVVHAVALARTALALAYAGALRSERRETCRRIERHRAEIRIAHLEGELAIKDARWSRVPPRQRPRYRPVERLRILELKAARGWTYAETARRFLLDEETIASWTKRIDEEGEHALVQTPEPVNRFPDFVGHLVRRLKALYPGMGRVRVAQTLARAGLHLAATTVERMFKGPSRRRETEAAGFEPDDSDIVVPRVVTAKYPGHVWHLDLSAVPTGAGFWVPWFPFTWAQSWPFAWWVAFVVDHFSRSVVGFAVFPKKPTSIEIRAFLGRAVRKAGKPPKHLITDKDKPFFCKAFKDWCRRREGIRLRFGAVGKHGSIALIERFIRSVKSECTRCLIVPLRRDAFRREVALYCVWYNEYRPNQALGGRTPKEVRERVRPANTRPRYEPRPRWPRGSPCAEPHTFVRGKVGVRLQLEVAYLEGRKHLPIVTLKRAA